MKKFVIIGTPRSGTTYIADVWGGLGMSCGHEKIFQNWGQNLETFAGWGITWMQGVASYSAMPFVDKIEEPHVVFHQIRDKQKTVESIMAFGWLSENPGYMNFQNFLDYHCDGELFKIKDYKERVEKFYDIWNHKCSLVADYSYNVEELNTDKMLDMCAMIGVNFDVERIETTLQNIPKNTNAKDHLKVMDYKNYDVNR